MNITRPFRLALALCVALGLWLLMQPVPARAGTIIVTSDADSGAGTLRQAIADAQPGDVIVFSGSMSIYLNSQLEVAKSLTIDGGAYTVVVSGDSDADGSSNVRVLQVTNNAHVTLAHLTLRDGFAWEDSGGGLKLEAGTVVTLTHSSVLNSVAKHGGGIFNAGALMVQNSLLFDNTAAGGNGGGIYNSQGALTVQNSTLSENGVSYNGGGIVNYRGALTVQNSTFSGNDAMYGSGGGLYNWQGTLNMQNTIIANSSRGDCANNDGVITSTHNLVRDGSCDAALSGDPLLGPLADNGGATLTYELLDGSPALEAGDNATCLPTDQRDVARPQGMVCDIGAFEKIWALSLTKTVTPTTNVAYHSLVTYTLALSNVSSELQPGVWLTDTLPPQVDFAGWVISPTNTTLSGNEIRWNGELAVGEIVTWTFQARHTGDYFDHVVNVAHFQGATNKGSVSASFDVICTPTYVVQNAHDSGPGSLRQGIASLCPGGSITFSGDDALYLSSTLVIAKDLTLDGAGYTIHISGDSDADDTPDVRVFQVTNGAHVTLAHVTILNGRDTSDECFSSSCGGGLKIEVGAAVTLTHSALFSSTAHLGGGIFNAGALVMQNSSVTGATAYHSGGGIYNRLGDLTLYNSTLSDNTARNGGGLYSSGALTVQLSTLGGNAATQNGGGLYNYAGAVTVQDCTLTANLARENGGGLYNDEGVVTVQTSTLSANSAVSPTFTNSGGGIFNQRGTLIVQASTLSTNSANYGGGITNSYGTLTLQNSTLSGNSGSGHGGGLYNSFGVLNVQNSTLSGNSAGHGGGLYNNQGALDYRNTIIANSLAGGDCVNSGLSSVITSTHNLVENGALCNPTLTSAPALGALTGNPATFALQLTSPAIDAGDPATCLPTDQRGFPRADLRCDLGAYELQHADGDTVVKSGMAAGATASFGPTRVRVTVTGGNAGTITATKHLTTPGGFYDTGEITATWYITASASPFTVTLAFCYTPEELGNLNAADLRAFRWNGSAWEDRGGAVAGGCVTVEEVTVFSAWTLFDTSKGTKPTAARVVALAARGGAPLVGLLTLGGVALLRRRDGKRTTSRWLGR